MVQIFAQDDARSLFGAGGSLNGFLNGEQIGRANRPLSALNQGLSRGQGLLGPPPAAAQPSVHTEPDRRKRIGEDDKDEGRGLRPKKDEVEIQEFAQDAIDQALSKAAQRPGATQQIVVSEDGRFEASIDLQVRSDGSFDLDIEVGFAESRAASISEIFASDPSLAQIGQSGASYAAVQQDTLLEFEQIVAGRDFEARIFYSEATHVAAEIGSAYGDNVGGEVRGVAGELAREYKLNISVSGESLESFNAQAREIAARDDGENLLGGFLTAASNLINSSPDNLDGFFQATQSLLDNAKATIASSLDSFFGDMQDQFGDTIEEFGFGPDFLTQMNEQSQQGLGDFFDVTNSLFGQLFGAQVDMSTTPQELAQDAENDILAQTIAKYDELRQEAINDDGAGGRSLLNGLDATA